MSNECVQLIRKKADSYRWLGRKPIACHQCGINNMYSRTKPFVASSLDLQGSRASGKTWPGSSLSLAEVVLR